MPEQTLREHKLACWGAREGCLHVRFGCDCSLWTQLHRAAMPTILAMVRKL